jgi:type II secretory pathway pseudopilin PulG
MKRGLKSSGVPTGFTIVETLIVLAVTAVLFTTIVLTFAGRQKASAFQQGIQEVRSRIQQSMNEVTNGYFPSTDNFTCTSNTPAQPAVVTLNYSPPTGNKQGTNQGCVFLGKVMEFPGTGSPQQYFTHTIAGYRSQDYLPLNNLDPTYVTSVTTDDTLKNGVTFVKMAYQGGTAKAVGFIYSLGKPGDSGIGFANGSQQVDVYAVIDPSFNGKMSSYVNTSTLATPGVQLCFKSGTTNQFALISIGGSDSVSTAKIQVTTQANCGI